MTRISISIKNFEIEIPIFFLSIDLPFWYQSPPRGTIFTGWYPWICIYRVSPTSRTVNAYALAAISSLPLPLDHLLLLLFVASCYTRRVLALLFLATKSFGIFIGGDRQHKSIMEKEGTRERRDASSIFSTVHASSLIFRGRVRPPGEEWTGGIRANRPGYGQTDRGESEDTRRRCLSPLHFRKSSCAKSSFASNFPR